MINRQKLYEITHQFFSTLYCTKTAKSPSRFCIQMYSWPKCNVVLKHFGFLPLLRCCCALRICEYRQEILLDWVMRSLNTFLSQSWQCFLPVSSQVRTVATTDSSAHLQLSRVTSSGKSSKNGLPIRLMVSERLVTCLWKVVCVERPCLWCWKFLGLQGQNFEWHTPYYLCFTANLLTEH